MLVANDCQKPTDAKEVLEIPERHIAYHGRKGTISAYPVHVEDGILASLLRIPESQRTANCSTRWKGLSQVCLMEVL